MEIHFIQRPPIKVDFSENHPKTGLPIRCRIRYKKHFFSPNEAAKIYKQLKTYNQYGLNDGGNMYGKIWKSDRKTIQVSDPGIPIYKYTGSSAKKTEPFTDFPVLERIRDILYDRTGYQFNFCLYNSYTPDAKLGWHSDSEKNMVKGSPIASLSFNFKRRFRVRKLDNSIVFDDFLESGSLLIMEDACQELTEHCLWNLTKTELENIPEGVDTIRINLTYRIMVPIAEAK